jgi:hypothetical protein
MEVPMAYLDEALKLDVRTLMAEAMKAGKKAAYSIRISAPGGQVIYRDLRDAPDRVATATVTVNWPEKPDQAVSGGIMLSYRGWDDRAAEQSVYLTGTPAKVGGYLWRIMCPETGQPVRALYLAPDGDRFQSRQASELKYRRASGKADHHLRRCYKLMHKLQTDHFGPGIGKPPGMSDRKFDKLTWQLTKEHIRYCCALLGKTEPDFPDEEPSAATPAVAGAKPRASLGRKPISPQSMYFRDRNGILKMRRDKKFAMSARD